MCSRQGIVQLLQVFGCIWFTSDLEELDTDLPWLCAPCVKLLGGLNDDRFDIVAGNTVGDDNDVQWLDRDFLAVGLALDRFLDLGEVRLEDMVKTGPGRSAPERSDRVEDALDADGSGDVCVAAGWIRRVAMVEEVDVDSVGITRGAGLGDCLERRGGFPPASAGHAATVVDEKDGVKLGKKGIWRIVGGLHRTGKHGRVRGWRICWGSCIAEMLRSPGGCCGCEWIHDAAVRYRS